MTWFISLFLLALVASSIGYAPKTRLHYLEAHDADDPILTEDEKDKYSSFQALWGFLDQDEDGKILLSDIESGAEFLSETGDHTYIRKPEMRRLLCNDPPLMNEDVFEDLWWILNHNLTAELEDYTELLFDYVDINGDDSIDDAEFRSFIKNAGRTRATPQIETVFHGLIVSLDADKSGGLDHVEIWGPITQLIEKKTITQLIEKKNEKKGISRKELAQLCQTYSGLSTDVLDFDKFTFCVDSDLDGYISFDDGRNIVAELDKNYNGQIDEFEMKNVGRELDSCVAEQTEKTKSLGVTEEVVITEKEQKQTKNDEL